jgi:hypothetical protein
LEVDVPELIEQKQRVWFIIDSETEYGNVSRDWVVSNTQLMEVRYLRTQEDLSMRLYLYDPSFDHPKNEE